MQEIILKISILKDYQIAFPFNGQAYEKLKGHETSNQSIFWLQNKFTIIHLLPGQV